MNPDPNSLARQNQELRDRLQGDAVAYRRRIDTYKQAQQNQAALVARLQSKVLQYKKKCNELEDRMIDTVGPLSPTTTPIKVISSYIFYEIVVILKNQMKVSAQVQNELTWPFGWSVFQPYGGGQCASSHAPPMSLPCITTSEQNKEFSSPYTQDDILNKIESDKLK